MINTLYINKQDVKKMNAKLDDMTGATSSFRAPIYLLLGHIKSMTVNFDKKSTFKQKRAVLRGIGVVKVMVGPNMEGFLLTGSMIEEEKLMRELETGG